MIETRSGGGKSTFTNKIYSSSATQSCPPPTLRDVKNENNGEGVSALSIDLSLGNIEIVPDQNIIMVVTLLENDQKKAISSFSGTENNGIITFTNPALVDSWAEPYLDVTNGVELTFNYVRIPHVGLNTDITQFRLAGEVIFTTADATWHTESELEPMGSVYQGGT